MFYCEDCRKRNDWPDSLSLSRGQCEACGKTAHCYDRPSSTLPMPKRGEMTTVREAARELLEALDHAGELRVYADQVLALRAALEADTVEVPRALNADLMQILGRMCFACGGIAEVFRRSGQDIPRKAEAEQAFVIHWLLLKYAEHGSDWMAKGEQELKALAAAPSQPETGP